MKDFLFRGELAALDPAVAELIDLEAERQLRRLIMIPSESTIPFAVREALTSAFHNIYAEGYPDDSTRRMNEAEIMDIDAHLAHFRRYSDPRYYKGTEFANLIEALARRRVAELFATPRHKADALYVNVQPLSGAPANSAVYTALIAPGDTIMGMNLLHGGHLSHGSPAARSGKQYNAVWYGVHPQTELIDYEAARQTALQHKPKIVIGGYSSYPYAPDWSKLRQIADEVGALLLADIAHVAGLVVAGQFPSPVGIADIVTFTTHKTFGGPRGAVIITHRADLYKKLDRGVFPGEQGGPHMNTVAALAVAAKLATTPQFHELQVQTVKNAVKLAECLTAHGLRVVHGGTDTHLLTVDCKTIVGADGTSLSGDMAARMLDLVGITCNRNTLPSDESAARPSGIRLGTPWITQRGFREPEIERLAAIIASVLKGAKPFSYDGKGGKADARAKLEYATFLKAQRDVAALCAEAGIDYDLSVSGKQPVTAGRLHFMIPTDADSGVSAISVRGAVAGAFLRAALTSAVTGLQAGEFEPTHVLIPDGSVMVQGVLRREADGYTLFVANGEAVAAWLQALSDGFVVYDPLDLHGKLPGPVVIRLHEQVSDHPALARLTAGEGYAASKAYFVGCNGAAYAGPRPVALPAFAWTEPTDAPLRKTVLHALHKDTLGAKMVPFAGYDMPVWYKGVSQEHAAVRTAAGLFDVTHMGVWDVRGPGADQFLAGLTANDILDLAVGDAHYSSLLGTDGTPLDDIYVYKLAPDHYMLVVNASNNDKDWAWAEAVRTGRVLIDPARPGAMLLDHPDQVTLRDLRDPAHGSDQRVDVALQGPKSKDILLSLNGAEADKKRVGALGWSQVTRATLGGFDLIVSRTGYTGERVAYELFVHPDQAVALFQALITAGAVPCGLAARDSLRTEAGLPLYGHELGGSLALTPGDAGFASYVKLWKPFFVGKRAYLDRELKREAVVTRFRLDNKGVRPPQPGAALVDRRGRVVGLVTSCSIDSDGYQTGQAYLKEEMSAEGTSVFVVAAQTADGKSSGAFALGAKVTVPDAATVLTKFPVKKK
jgi:glycine hydroxymethyltransferase